MTSQEVPIDKTVATNTLSLLLDTKNVLGEGVLWCERSQQVYWTDIQAQRLHCYHPESRRHRTWIMPERLGCFAFTNNEHILLLGLATRLAFFDLYTEALSDICPVENNLPTTRINDGRCDRQGRFVFGTMDESQEKTAIGSFYRLNTDLQLERLPLPHCAIANGICFSVDGTTMYFCDSMERRIFSWTDYALGETSSIRVFADLRADPRTKYGAPDGATVDADSFLWSAHWGGSRVVRYTPNGEIDRILSLPVSQPSCISFGGPQLNEMFVTSASESLSAERLANEPLAGGLFHATLNELRGIPEARFGGTI